MRTRRRVGSVVTPPCPHPDSLLLVFQVSRPVMEKVPYALKLETCQSCLTLSARYGEVGRGRVWGIEGQDFTGVKGWNNKLVVSFLFWCYFESRDLFSRACHLNITITISHVCKSLQIIGSLQQCKKLRRVKMHCAL